MQRHIIQADSPAYAEIKSAIEQGRKLSLAFERTGVQVKIGEGMWTLPLSMSSPPREDDDARTFKRQACEHLVCQKCGGHKTFRETWQHEDEPADSPNHDSCMCCKHCGRLGGH